MICPIFAHNDAWSSGKSRRTDLKFDLYTRGLGNVSSGIKDGWRFFQLDAGNALSPETFMVKSESAVAPYRVK